VMRALFRHKRAALAFFLCATTGAVLWNVLCPSTFRSEGKILVRLGRENVALDPTVTLGSQQMITLPSSRESEINSVVEGLRSRVLIEKAVAAIGPGTVLNEEAESVEAAKVAHRSAVAAGFRSCKQWIFSRVLAWNLDQREQAVREVMDSFEVAPAPKSNVICVCYDASSPELAQTVLAKLIELFEERHARINRPSGAQEFLDEQSARIQKDLVRTEEELRGLKKEKRLVSAPERRKILEDRAGRLEDDLLQTRSEIAAAESAAAHLKQELGLLPATEVSGQTTGIGDEGTNRMRDRLYALQLTREEMRTRYADTHPKMQEIQQQVAAAEELLEGEEPTRSQVTTAPDKTHQQARIALLDNASRRASLRARTASLETELAEARREVDAFNDTDLRIARLERELAIAEGNYRRYSAALEESRIDKALEAQGLSNISVLQPATYDVKPHRPRRLLNLLIGLAGGAFGGFVLSVLLEYLDHSFITGDDIEKRLGTPILAEIPRLPLRELRLN